jgi:hypothetical protein
MNLQAEAMRVQAAVAGGCFDVQNAVECVMCSWDDNVSLICSTVTSMCAAGNTFKRIHERLRTAIQYKQQLDMDRMKRYT